MIEFVKDLRVVMDLIGLATLPFGVAAVAILWALHRKKEKADAAEEAERRKLIKNVSGIRKQMWGNDN